MPVPSLTHVLHQAASLHRSELPEWEIMRSSDSVSRSRRLTHIETVEGLLQHVSIDAGARILDSCGGRNDAVAVCHAVSNAELIHEMIWCCR